MDGCQVEAAARQERNDRRRFWRFESFLANKSLRSHTTRPTLPSLINMADQKEQQPMPEPAAAAAQPAGGEPAAAKESKKDKKPKGPTKKELRMMKREQEAREAAARLAERCADTFGELPIIQSTRITGRVWTRVGDITPEMAGTTVLVRARVHNSRMQGKKLAFVNLRQAGQTIQSVIYADGKGLPKEFVKWSTSLPRETIVDVTAEVSVPGEPVASCSVSGAELQVRSMFVVSKALPTAPFNVEDAMVPEPDEEQEAAAAAAAAGGEAGDEQARGIVTRHTRLNHRWIDLRTPANQAIVRISSAVCRLYREFLTERGFIEIQSPKIIGGASEGGADVFKLKYFGNDACLAQSPQLYKQMTAACGDMERVFEIGPVFRAENSNTHRHLCEFHGLDMEMIINEHYWEVLDVFSDLFIYMFSGLQEQCAAEIAAVNKQYPAEPFKFLRPALRLTYREGIDLLKEAGVEASYDEDLSTPQEKALGRIVKEKYDTDFFMLDKFPLSARPFYTMPDPENPELSNSYDFFMRGEEILSGAQRVHDPELLVKRAEEFGIPLHTLQGYLDSFKHGAYPHAGGGVGLERVVMLFLGLPNIRNVAFFPRDPKRLQP